MYIHIPIDLKFNYKLQHSELNLELLFKVQIREANVILIRLSIISIVTGGQQACQLHINKWTVTI